MILKVLSVETIRQVEAAADAAGYNYATMMTDAGQAVADRVLQLITDRAQPKVTVLVGPGNNGGDGLIAGKLIAQGNPEAQIRFYLLAHRESNDPVFNSVVEPGLFIVYAEDDHDNRVLRNMVASSDVIVDALFGIGARLPIKAETQKLLRGTNQALKERAEAQRNRFTSIDPTVPGQIEYAPKQYVIAVDCPSGLNCDTGELDKNALTADETVTFIAAKPGLFTFPGAASVGKLLIAPLAIPEGIKPLEKAKTVLLDQETVRTLLPERPADAHKGTFGKVLIVAGSVNYTGAPALSAQAAYRSGAGLVAVGAPAPVIAVLSAQILEATWLLLAHDMGVLAESAATTIRTELAKCQSLLLGPGMGRENTTRNLLQTLFAPRAAQSKRDLGFSGKTAARAEDTEASTLPPLVIDADGLSLLSEIENWWTLLPQQTILTPHPGEMARLCGITSAEVQANRIKLAQEKATKWKAIVVLKGAHTLIAAPDGQLAYSPFKTDALATAGTGDVLAGIIVGLLAQGLKPFDAARTGVYIQGLAGVLAAAQAGSGRGVIASDVLAAIPAALSAIEQK